MHMRAKDRGVSRRKLLIGCALGALTPCIANRAGLAETSDLADFLRLSAELTGRTRLQVDSARIYLQSLGLDRGALSSIDPLHDKDSERLARRIVADWYSGQTVDSGRMICVDYTGALMWDAMGFARPGGIPGEAASWALAPTKE
ncbi:sorbitol dehydrogenase family protein [Methylocystis suflitae]|uniref:sorbitol dehydrogenase family protein n=1 Tax=Methylocystis suflitae TaxID=2951405 RepID=UPI0021096EA6|nr:sorbitol dehydrogenase family protein [Methylocystis suflitae]MCQ4189159.1 sorbitol dehydrogenase family protein [Methylocystis suflitae]